MLEIILEFELFEEQVISSVRFMFDCCTTAAQLLITIYFTLGDILSEHFHQQFP